MPDARGYIPCQHGHVIIFNSKDTGDRIPPAGSHCMCGMMVADGKGGSEAHKREQQSSMSLKDIIKEWLVSNGYDGLYCTWLECGCKVDDLMPCDSPHMEDCLPGCRYGDDCVGPKQ